MVEAEQLTKQFGAFEAVRGISLTIRPGEVLALLGPNGAGKTTTVRMLSAILKPSSGWARIAGLDVVTHAHEVRAKVGLLTEYPGLYNRMRALEYLHFFGSLLDLSPAECQQRAVLLLQRFGLWEAREKRLDAYSKGMKQKIALVRALMHDPPVLFLDEPTTAMDPHSARVVRDAIDDLRGANRSILLTTHNLNEAEVLADRIAIIRGGQIVAEGTQAQLERQLLGEPLWSLRTDRPVPDVDGLIGKLVHVEKVQGETVFYRSSQAEAVNPQIVQRLTERGIAIIALSEQARSLEDVYLQIVGDYRSHQSSPDADASETLLHDVPSAKAAYRPREAQQ